MAMLKLKKHLLSHTRHALNLDVVADRQKWYLTPIGVGFATVSQPIALLEQTIGCALCPGEPQDVAKIVSSRGLVQLATAIPMVFVPQDLS
jgi:hypothetical protein